MIHWTDYAHALPIPPPEHAWRRLSKAELLREGDYYCVFPTGKVGPTRLRNVRVDTALARHRTRAWGRGDGRVRWYPRLEQKKEKAMPATTVIPRSLPAPGWRKLEPHEIIRKGDIVCAADGTCVFRAADIGDRADHATRLNYYRKEEAVNEVPTHLPAPGWRKLADSEIIAKGDVYLARSGNTGISENIGLTVAKSTRGLLKEYYRKEETVSNEDKIQRLKALVDELAAAGIDAAAEAQKIAQERPKGFRDSSGQEVKVDDWLKWETSVEGASPDYGPVTHVTDTHIYVRGAKYPWCFSEAGVERLARIPTKPDVPGHKVLDYRSVQRGDTYFGTDGIVYVSTSSFSGTRERWILEKIQPKLLASDGKELKVGDWVSWDEEVACAEPDYGPVTYAEGDEVRVDRQRCGYTGYFRATNIQKLNRIPAKPNPIPGYRILEPGYAKRGQWWWSDDSRHVVQATADYDKHTANLRWLLEPVPQYRPFKDATEALGHITRAVQSKSDPTATYDWAIWTEASACILRRRGTSTEWVGTAAWRSMFENYTFEDGTPFGIKD